VEKLARAPSERGGVIPVLPLCVSMALLGTTLTVFVGLVVVFCECVCEREREKINFLSSFPIEST